jgi:tetratricopeptide (TPR) repeat protein
VLTEEWPPEQLVALAEDDPRRALALAGEMLDREIDDESRVNALRALGLARRALGDAIGSVVVLEEAGELAEAIGNRAIQGEVELNLAWSVALVGEVSRASEIYDSAASKLDDHGRARAILGRAGLLARSGDLAASLPLYGEAEQALSTYGNDRWLAALHANRGLVLAYMGRFEEAQQDLQSAHDLYVILGYESSAAEMTHNLGFLAVQTGDIPEALRLFDDTEARYRSLDIPISELLLDRAEALLLVGLPAEAYQMAMAASGNLEDAGLQLETSEALVMAARAALAAGDPEGAMSVIRRATRLLETQGRPGWLLHSRYLRIAAAFRAGERITTQECIALADELQRTGQLFAGLHARLLAGQLAIGAGDVSTASEQLALSAATSATPTVDLRVQACLATALLRMLEGQPSAAYSAVRAGARIMDDYRSTLGATESRLRVALHAAELFDAGRKLAYLSGRPSRLLEWVDRSRSGAMRLIAPRPPLDQDLALAMAELRRVQGEIREAERDQEPVGSLRREQYRIERTVRSLSMRQRGSETSFAKSPSLAELQDLMDSREMVVLTDVEGELVAVRVRERSIRMLPLGRSERVVEEAGHLSRNLRMMSVRANEPRRSTESFEKTAEILDELIFRPLRLREESLVLIPPPALHSLPWAALPTFRERVAVVSPSSFAWFRAETSEPHGGNAVLVAGPRLSQADQEVDQLAAIYSKATVLKGSSASVDRVVGKLQGCAVAHLACHSRFRADNAMFSALECADGDLTVYDIEAISTAPSTIVLSACDSGLSERTGGDELMGLSVALLGLGARSIVVTVAPLPDASPTVALMRRLHLGLVEGLAPAAALQLARQELTDDNLGSFVAGAAFFCMGA